MEEDTYIETKNAPKLRELLSEYSLNKKDIDILLYFLPTEEARQKMIDFIEQEKPATTKEIARKVPEFGNLRLVVPED